MPEMQHRDPDRSDEMPGLWVRAQTRIRERSGDSEVVGIPDLIDYRWRNRRDPSLVVRNEMPEEIAWNEAHKY